MWLNTHRNGNPLINPRPVLLLLLLLCRVLLSTPFATLCAHNISHSLPFPPSRMAAMRARRCARKRICHHPRTARRADRRASSKCPDTAVKFGCATSPPQTVIYNTIIFVHCTNSEQQQKQQITRRSRAPPPPDEQLVNQTAVPIDIRR